MATTVTTDQIEPIAPTDTVSNGGPGPVAKPASSQGEQGIQESKKTKDTAQVEYAIDEKPYSVFTRNEKRLIIFCAGCSAFFSPVSGAIYFPSLNTIAADLNVSISQVNLTITTYLILQGLAPSFVAGFSDSSGRRPAYIICLLIYCAANIGLGIQKNYAALLVLRCLQSAGGSGTVALANAVASDVVTSAERGAYVSYMSVAAQAGPSLGPIIGGLLGQYLGWHAIFWFLLICACVVSLFSALFLAETCRVVVDDGSVPPPKLSRCYINKKVEKRLLAAGQTIPYDKRDELAAKRKLRFPNPLETVKIVFTKEAGFVLGYIGLLAVAYYATVTLLPSQFGRVYNFDEIRIALCYIPLGCGSLLAGFVRGGFIDRRYKYHAKRLGMPLEYNRRVDLSNFPIERARLEVAVPTIALGCACFIGFGWMVEYKVNLAGPLIFLFIIGFCVSSSMNTVSVLLVDIFPGKTATASAAANMVRCWMGAGATSGVEPLIKKVGMGWATTFFALLVIATSPILWYVMEKGPGWRRAAKAQKDKEAAEKAARREASAQKEKA